MKTISEVNEYIQDGAKRHGSKNKFLSSKEYADMYPIIEKIYNAEKIKEDSTAYAAMKEVGAAYGDRVTYTLFGMFFTTDTLTGTLVCRNGLPMVKLDSKFNGKRFTQWHKGWKKI